MESNHTQKILGRVFLPAFLLSILLGISSGISVFTQDLIKITMGNAEKIALVKSFSFLPQLVLGLILITAAKYVSFEKIFKGTLIALIVATPLLFLFKENLSFFVFFGTLDLLKFNVFSILIWGFVNQFTSRSDGIKYYILVSFVMGLIQSFISAFALPILAPKMLELTSSPAILMFSFAIAFMILALLVFHLAWKKINSGTLIPEESSALPKFRFPVLYSAYLMAGSVMIANSLGIFFKYKVQAGRVSFSQVMGSYSETLMISTLVVTILWTLLCSWLILKKGWKTTALFGSISTLVGGFIYLITYYQPVSWFNQALINGLLTGTVSTLFFPLIQIAYLYLPVSSRFKTKVMTEMLALPLLKIIPFFITTGLFMSFNSMLLVEDYVTLGLTPVMLVLLVVASKRISSWVARFS